MCRHLAVSTSTHWTRHACYLWAPSLHASGPHWWLLPPNPLVFPIACSVAIGVIAPLITDSSQYVQFQDHLSLSLPLTQEQKSTSRDSDLMPHGSTLGKTLYIKYYYVSRSNNLLLLTVVFTNKPSCFISAVATKLSHAKQYTCLTSQNNKSLPVGHIPENTWITFDQIKNANKKSPDISNLWPNS